MLSIFAKTEYVDHIQQMIKLEDRLDELVKVHEAKGKVSHSETPLFVNEQGVEVPIIGRILNLPIYYPLLCR